MATTLQHCNTATPSAPAAANPQLKRIVYSKYRELLGSYNDKANAIIETLPAYMVREDRGFHFEPITAATTSPTTTIAANRATGNAAIPAAACLLQQLTAVQAQAQAQGANNANGVVAETYGGASGQRGYEAPACVQNAMMTKDKKPFTYTPGGIDLSQIKSERMAKRLARNAQAEGATGASQQNRPNQPQSPSSTSNGSAAAAMGAAAMGVPFQVLPPPPPPSQAGKKLNGTPAPPPPPPCSTLAPPTNGGPGSAPGSPKNVRKSPTPQNFEPPPLGFRPEIKIPPNPMAILRKVPPPVEKNTFWKDEYVKERSKSPMVGENDRASSPSTSAAQSGGAGYGELANANNNNNNSNMNNDYADGIKKSLPATSQQPETNYGNNYAQQQQYSPQQQQYSPQQQQSPPTPSYQRQPQQQHQQYSSPPPPPPVPILTETPPTPRPEFRSVPVPQSPAISVYTRQTDSPGTPTQQRAADSAFRYGPQSPQQQQPQQQQPQQQQRNTPTISPLAQQQQQKTYTPPSTPAGTTTASATSGQPQAQTVPWRTQRSQPPPAQTQQQQQQPHATAIYNNVQQQQQQQPYAQQQRSRDVFSPVADTTPAYGGAQNTGYQGPKPTSVGSLYIAPLGPATEPQAQNIVRQQMQQQQQQRDSPMRQAPQQQQSSQQQQHQPPTLRQPARWMSTQPVHKEQPEWARGEENGNVVPSSLHRIKSPPPAQSQQHQSPTLLQQQQQQQQQQHYQPQPSTQGNGWASPSGNFGSQSNAPTGLRLQINSNTVANQNGRKERIIPIQLEQTPTNTPSQPSFNNPIYGIVGAGAGAAPTSYVIRSPNQFVDQGYNNYPNPPQQQPTANAQRVMSPTQQLNAPRIVQQQQQFGNNVAGGSAKTRIVPIALEGGEGTRGPISQAPIVLQNDPRSPPVQSKSFRILQKITDTIDDGSGDSPTASGKKDSYIDAEPQLQRPHYARQMSAQQARHSPTTEQMRRMQIAQEQQQQQQQQSPQAWNQDIPQPYIHPSEQQVPEPKKYTGSAIPSRSFKILQAMTTPENAGPGQSDL